MSQHTLPLVALVFSLIALLHNIRAYRRIKREGQRREEDYARRWGDL
jgi:hypothetical protein